MLILARGLQGLGAALVSPAALSIVTTTFAEGAERAKALGVWAAIAVGGGAVGLVLGGLLVETLSWPWIFFVNVPVGIAAFVLSLRLVPESKDEHVHKSFDLAGAVTVTAGLIALVYGIVRSSDVGLGLGRGARLPRRSPSCCSSPSSLIERRSVEPLVRLSIFAREDRARRERRDVRRRGRAVRDVLLQHALRAARARLLAARVGPRVPAVHGRDHHRRGALAEARARRSARARCRCSAPRSARSACSSSSGSRPTASYLADLLPGIMLTSIGMGLVFVPITLIATSGVPADDAGLASGLFNTSQQIGGALGLALLTTLSTNRTEDELASLGRQPTPADTADALVSGFHLTWLASAILLAAGGLLLLALLRRRDVVAVAEGEVAPVAA